MSSSSTETTLIDVVMPQMGVSVSEGTIVEWRKQVGDWVEYEEAIVDISTDKIDTELPSPAAGRVAEIVVEVGTTVEVGTVLARLATDAKPGQPHASEGNGAPPTSEAAAATGETPVEATVTPVAGAGHRHADDAPRERPARGARRYSPVVQRIAAEHDVDLDQVQGTGRDGRVRKQDVLAFLDSGPPRRRRRGGPAAAHRVALQARAGRRRRRRPPRPPAPAPAPTAAPAQRRRLPAAGGRPAVAHAQARRRPHEALARHGGHVHDVDRGRHVARRARAPRGRADRAAVRGPRHHRRAARVPRAQRLAGGRPAHRPHRRQPRHRRVAGRRRPDRPGHPRRPGPLRRGAVQAHQGARPRGALAHAAPRRRPGRHVHHHQPGPVRIGDGDARHQPAAGRDPRPRGGREAPGRGDRRGRQRLDRHPPDDGPRPVVGPPRPRRRPGRAVPGRGQAPDRGL